MDQDPYHLWPEPVRAKIRWLQEWKPPDTSFKLSEGLIVYDAGKYKRCLLNDLLIPPSKYHLDAERVAVRSLERLYAHFNRNEE